MGSCGTMTMDGEEVTSTALLPQSWFDLRVFYVRISNYILHASTPEFLTLCHAPLEPEECLLEVNGKKVSGGVCSEGVTSLLRRDRVDKKSGEVTFVSTDNIRFNGGVMFTVFNGKEFMLEGTLDMCKDNGVVGESQKPRGKWTLRCESKLVDDDSGFLKGQYVDEGFQPAMPPTLEVYVAGCFSGAPVILTNTLQLLKKGNQRSQLDMDSSEYGMNGFHAHGENQTQYPSGFDLQLAGYSNYKNEKEGKLDHLYGRSRREYLEGEEEGELSWFNAGVRVGVGISLGVCLGVGVGIGLLARTYQKACRHLAKGLR